ncbi:MAG TPA: ABC transporter permease [Gemmatimonadaceae bacterium]|nr:ABC transporter permease [Gemmatimonadaceae bacterium]
MRSAFALIQASWRTQRSYRVSIILSILMLGVTVLPVYFVSQALQPYMAPSIANQGQNYFGFLVIGMVALMFVSTTVSSIPDSIGAGIGNGTLEALLATRASIPSLLAGMVGYSFLWTAVKGVLFLALAMALGLHLSFSATLSGLLILALIVLAHVPFALLAASLVLAFRTTASIPSAVMVASGLLGGVYWSMSARVIPHWVQVMSNYVPLAPGLRALRQTLLEGASLSAVMPDVLLLIGFVVMLNALGCLAFVEALRYARRSGTLAQY